MQVLLLATDEDGRAAPLASMCPAPLIPIIDRPVMARVIEQLARAGLKTITVSLYQRGGDIMSYFGDGRRWGLKIEYLTQREARGSAGAIKWASQRLHETFLVMSADALVDVDVEAALTFHRAHGGSATAIVAAARPGADPRFVLDDLDRIQPAGAAGTQVMPTGVYLFEPDVIAHIASSGTSDIVAQLVPALLAAGQPVYCYRLPGYFNPLLSYADHSEAQRVVLQSALRRKDEQVAPEHIRLRFPTLDAQQIAPGVWVGQNHVIHPSAQIAAPIYIGEGCRIGANVELGPDTVLGAGVIIDDEATVQRSTILAGTYVGRLVNIVDRVVDRTSVINVDSGEISTVVDPFLLADVDRAARRGRRQRILSLLVALVALVASLPLQVALGVLAFFASGGRVIERSTRIGRQPAGTDGAPERQFSMLTLATRRRDGTRSTLGVWMRRYELDRLPALWNVVIGDLDLVGVRPLTLGEFGQIRENWHRKRFECPAGLTGLWYINTNPGAELDEVLIADAYYTATRTWREDLRLMAETPAAWRRRAAHEQHTASDSLVYNQP